MGRRRALVVERHKLLAVHKETLPALRPGPGAGTGKPWLKRKVAEML